MLDGWKDLKPFKAWCVQVLPTIFDESMSYYECLCKMVKLLNDTMNNVDLLNEAYISFTNSTNDTIEEFIVNTNNTIEEFKVNTNDTIEEFKVNTNDTINEFTNSTNDTIEEFKVNTNITINEFKGEINSKVQELEEFMDNYFDNLDVQEEINNKLDALVENGTFNSLILPMITEMQNPLFVDNISQMKNHNRVYVLKSTGNIYTWSGSSFTNTGMVYGSVTNALQGYGSIFLPDNIPENFKDLNNLPTNKIMWFQGITDLVNEPYKNFQGCIISFGHNSQSQVSVQYALGYNNQFYQRLKRNSWGDWNLLMQGKGINPVKDVSKLEGNGVYIFTNQNDLVNAPVLPFNGWIVTFKHTANTMAQFYLAFENGNLYVAHYVGMKWVKINTSSPQEYYPSLILPTTIPDFNNLPQNISGIISSSGNTFVNAPYSSLYGSIETYGYGRSTELQKILDARQNILFYRFKNTTDYETGWKIPKNEFIISVKGKRPINFTYLRDAINYANQYDFPVTIEINEGDYNILQEYGGTQAIKDTTETNWRKVSHIFKNGKLKGIGRVNLNFRLPKINNDNWKLFSALSISGNVEVENIVINAIGCRYGIHDESSGLFPNSKRHFKNVTVNYESVGNQGWRAYGGGYDDKSSVIFDDCIFNSNSDVWSCHCGDGISLIFNNCVFIGNDGAGIRISQTDIPSHINFKLMNSFLNRLLKLRSETAQEGTVCQTIGYIVNTYLPNISSNYTNGTLDSIIYVNSKGNMQTVPHTSSWQPPI